MKRIFFIAVFMFFITTLPAYATYVIYCKDGSERFVIDYNITETGVTYTTKYGTYHLLLNEVNIEKTEYERDMKDHGPRWQELQRKAEENQQRVQREAEELKKEMEIRRRLEEEAKIKQNEARRKQQLEEFVSPAIQEQDAKESRAVAINLINEWRIGNSGSQYWSEKYKYRISRLFNVKDYEYLTHKPSLLTDTNTKWISHTFRIRSTNKGGMPIEVIWEFFLERDESGWKVVGFLEK
jgi:hypothetical protein